MWIEPSDILIVIPAYNEGERISTVLKSLNNLGYSKVLVVDDGSSDNTAAIATANGARVLSHLINRGPGAATMTGIQFARKKGYRYMVTLDGDGQHEPEDIQLLVDKARETEADIVIGNRFTHPDNQIPFIRKMFNGVANSFTSLLARSRISDSQTGFKFLGPKAIADLDLHIDGYGFCSELFIQGARKDLSFDEVPVRVYYHAETLKKGQSFKEGLKTAWQLIQHTLLKD